jgi:phosphohistidine phosphatase
LRHAKSDWDSAAPSDFERPLNKRGQKDAPRMGRWLHDRCLNPDLILASPAQRAKETILAMAEPMEFQESLITWEARIYEASRSTLVEILREVVDDHRRVMLVGHNPGLESLILYLTAGGDNTPPDYGFFKTASMARIAMPDHWVDIHQGSGKLLEMMHPRELPEGY